MSDDLRSWLASAQQDEQQKQQSYLHESMDALAMRLGQMQAQVLRLDTLGARLAKMSGMKPQEFNFEQTPPQGGPFLPAAQHGCVHVQSGATTGQLVGTAE